MSCSKCKFAVYLDNGYSNYTVMGTDFYCAKKLHPADGFDVGYGLDKGLSFGDNCSGRVEGGPLSIDVEHEAVDEFTTEERVIWDMHRA